MRWPLVEELREELRDLCNAVLRVGFDRHFDSVHEQAVEIINRLDSEKARRGAEKGEER